MIASKCCLKLKTEPVTTGFFVCRMHVTLGDYVYVSETVSSRPRWDASANEYRSRRQQLQRLQRQQQ